MRWQAILGGEGDFGDIVPRSGASVALTLLASAAMAFLAVFIAAIAFGADRLGDSWEQSLAGTATVRASATEGDAAPTSDAIIAVLTQTPGIEDARSIGPEEQTALLRPWLGDDVPLDLIRLPVLVEVTLTDEGPDAEDLAARLAEAVPGAVYDDHGRWREPVLAAAGRVGLISAIALLLVGVISAAVIALAVSASLSANRQVIDVLRLVGARDLYIIRLFVRRFALRAAAGAAIGALVGAVGVALVPETDGQAGLAGIGFDGWEWLWPVSVPVLAALIAYAATRTTAMRRLKEVS